MGSTPTRDSVTFRRRWAQTRREPLHRSRGWTESGYAFDRPPVSRTSAGSAPCVIPRGNLTPRIKRYQRVSAPIGVEPTRRIIGSIESTARPRFEGCDSLEQHSRRTTPVHGLRHVGMLRRHVPAGRPLSSERSTVSGLLDNLALVVPLLACVGMHLALHRLTGKSCHGEHQNREAPAHRSGSGKDSG